MFQRILRWRGLGFALALALAFGLAAPARAASAERNGAGQVAALLQTWWMELWTEKVTAPPPASLSGPAFEVDRTSTIDPNGLKSARLGATGERRGQPRNRQNAWF